MATTKKVTDLTALTTATGDDLLYIVNDPSGTPGSRKITVSNFFANVQTNTRISGATLTVNAVTTMAANVNLSGATSYITFPDSTKQNTAFIAIPNTTTTANTVTIQSNGTSIVPFLTFQFPAGKTGCADLVIHARDVQTDEITAGHVSIAVQNSSSIALSQSVAQVGANIIDFNNTPTVNNTSNTVTLYVGRGSASTSNVLIRYSLIVF